jgi:uncharacterized integral membrane protein
MSNKPESGLTGAALFVAIAVIIAWLLLLVWLVQRTDATEVIWSRLLVLLSSMEAVAFGAAGALFGTSIQRQRVADARTRAEKAEKEAGDNKDASTKGKALAAAVKATARSRRKAGGPERLSATSTPEPDDEIVALANALFPDNGPA